MIRKLSSTEFDSILYVINNAAEAYRDVIPEDRWKEPYMSAQELSEEVESGVQFYGWMEEKALVAVMGMQQVRDITLIRHAYVLPDQQRKKIGQNLLKFLLQLSKKSQILVGTWKAAWWAIRFYEKNGFVLTSRREKNRLLREYWAIPKRQVETSVVLSFNRKY
jgi:GNAT superfamily N-acetyltransferase